MPSDRDAVVRPHRQAPSRGNALWGTIFGLAVVFVALEITLRIHNPYQFRMRGDHIELPRNEIYHLRNIDPNTGKFVDLGGKLDVEIVHTKNSLGFRGPEPPADFAGSLTMLAVGGSTTECFFLGDGQDWPARLAADLTPHFKSLWIDNAGLDGQSTFGNVRLMQDYVARLRPRVVMILAGINEPFTDAPTQYDSKPVLTALGWLGRYSEVAALALNLYHQHEVVEVKDLGPLPRPLNFWDPPKRTPSKSLQERLLAAEVPRLDAYRSRLQQIIDIARGNGIEPVLITQPAVFGPGIDDATGVDLATVGITLNSPMAGGDAWALLDGYNDVMRSVGRAAGVTTIDLARELPKSTRYFYDFVHFSKEGARQSAAIIAADLCPHLKAEYPQLATGSCPARP